MHRHPSTPPTNVRAGSPPRFSVWARVWGAISLIHPFPAATVVVTSAVLLIVAFGRLPAAGFFARAVAAVAMTQIAIGALNDYLDRQTDAAGQPWKPIPSGRAPPRIALALVALGIAGTLGLSATFGFGSLLLLALAASGGIAYDLWLKPTPLSIVGYLIGFLTLVTWLWYIAGRLVPLFVLVYPLGAIALLTAHLAQSLPDIESDRARGQHGLAATLGVPVTLAIVRAGTAAMIVGSLILGALSGSKIGLLLSVMGGLLGAYALARSTRRSANSEDRRVLFPLVAMTIALLVISSLASIAVLIR